MKRLIVTVITLISILPSFYASAVNEIKQHKNQLRYATYNIRGDLPKDGINMWTNRRDSLCNIILDYKFDVVGLQEVIAHQLTDIIAKTNYAAVGQDSLYNPILFNPARVELVKWDMFWLSESMKPHEIGWDGRYERYCTWALFKDKATKKEFYVFNTHLDHRGIIARPNGAELTCKEAIRIAGTAPLIIAGDMNCHDNTETYQRLCNYFLDARSRATFVFGPKGTAHNFGKVHPVRIDYIFTPKTIQIHQYNALDIAYDNNFFPSDHYPVFVDITIK